MTKAPDFLNDILPLKNSLYRTALRITLNSAEAEDVVQNTLIKVWRQQSEQGEISSLEAYAYTVCRHLALDAVKHRAHQTVPLDSLTATPAASGDPLEQMTADENLRRIEQFINTLPEGQRTCMQLRDIEGRSYKEIAQVLAISEEQVKINIFRARRAVRERFLTD